MSTRKKPMSPAAKVGWGILAVIQFSFAALAYADLAGRKPKEINGPKGAWIPAILVNWIGPAAYFLFGVRRKR